MSNADHIVDNKKVEPIQLHPCPFCGVTEMDYDDGGSMLCLEEDRGTDYSLYAKCSGCLAEGPHCETEEEAVERWNKVAREVRRG